MAEETVTGKLEGIGRPAKARDYIFEKIIDATINDYYSTGKVNVGGFRKFSLMARFDGQPSAKIRFEIGYGELGGINRSLTLAREIFNIGVGGYYNFSKVYDVFSPDIYINIYEFPPNLKIEMYIYAGY